MRRKFNICSQCGNYLDIGEKCNCAVVIDRFEAYSYYDNMIIPLAKKWNCEYKIGAHPKDGSIVRVLEKN